MRSKEADIRFVSEKGEGSNPSPVSKFSSKGEVSFIPT